MGFFDALTQRRPNGREIEPLANGVLPTHVPHATMDTRAMMSLFKKQFGPGAAGNAMLGGWSAYGSGSYAGRYTSGPQKMGAFERSYGGTTDSVDWVYACVSLISSTGASYPYRITDLSGETQEHPPPDLVSLLEKPNADWTWFDLIEHILMDLELCGNGYYLKDMTNGLGQPLEVRRLLPDRMQVVTGPNGDVIGYAYTPRQGIAIPYMLDEVIHFKAPNPIDEFYGMGTVEGIASLLDRLAATGEHITGYFRNGARISGVLTVPGTLTDVAFERMKESYAAQFAGSASAYKLLIAEGTTDYKPIGQTPVASGVVDLMQLGKDEVLSAFGVPEFLLGGAHQAGVEKMEEAQNIFLRAMVPKARRVQEKLMHDLVSLWPGMDLVIDAHANEPLSVRISYAKEMIGAGAKIQEAREAQGLPPLEPGDPGYELANEVLVPNTMIPLSIVGQPPRPPMSIPSSTGGDGGAGGQPALPSGQPQLPPAGHSEANGVALAGLLDQVQPGAGKQLMGLLEDMRSSMDRLKSFNPDQARDSHGRWSSEGGGDDSDDDDDSHPAADAGVIAAAKLGGGTIDPATGEQPKSGYAVAMDGHSSITPAAKFFEEDPDTGEARGVAITDAWLKSNADLFDSDSSLHVGVWNDPDSGNVFLDPTQVVEDRDEAIQAGRDNDQIAIYHLDSGETIPTGGSGGLDGGQGKAVADGGQAEAEDRGHERRGAPGVRPSARGFGGEGEAEGREGLSVALSRLAQTVGTRKDWVPPRLPAGFEQIGYSEKAEHRTVREGQAEALRHGVDTFRPAMRKFFKGQRQRVLEAVSEYGDPGQRAAKLKAKPKYTKDQLSISRLWDIDAENDALRSVYDPALNDVVGFAMDCMPSSAKAVTVPPLQVNDFVDDMKATLGAKITGVNDTTRNAVAEQITTGLQRGYSIPQIANGYPDENYPGIMGVFDEAADARAEMIARTESAFAFNGGQAALFQANGVQQVEILDGTQWDEGCASADGQVWTLEQYQANPIEHPNCTRCAVPAPASTETSFDDQ